MNESPQVTGSSKRSKKRELLSWLITIAIAVAVALVIRFFILEFVPVDGPSMQDTLYTHDLMVVTKLDYVFGKPQRGDIVVTRFEGKQGFYVKRLIGLPGETIEIRNGDVYIDGTIIDDNYATEKPEEPLAPTKIPEDHIFVMGDNRNDSLDSRYLGTVPMKDVVGVAHLVIYPFNRIQVVGR
jgi:signal peptidase I